MIGGLSGIKLAIGVGAAIVVFGGGIMTGRSMAAGKIAKIRAESTQSIEAARTAARKLIDRANVDRETARAQVAELNAAIAKQTQELLARLEADAATRTKAQEEIAAFVRRSEQAARAARLRADQIKGVLQNASDACARAGVDPDIVGLLNDLIASGDAAALSASNRAN